MAPNNGQITLNMTLSEAMTGLCNNDGVVICLVKENLWPVTRSKFCMTPSWDFNHGYSLVCKKCSHFLWFMSWDKNSHEMCFSVQRDIWVVNWWKENINVGYVCLHVDGWLLLQYVPSGLVVIHSSVYKYIYWAVPKGDYSYQYNEENGVE